MTEVRVDIEALQRLPGSWSELSWRQLEDCWRAKVRYGGNADVARAAALLALLGLEPSGPAQEAGGEPSYMLRGADGRLWTATPREVSQAAGAALRWFDFPYGDPGEKAEYGEDGRVVRERREPVAGYVGPMNDALQLPEETLRVGRRRFALPQVACVNLTWQQYRSLQGITPMLFREGVPEQEALDLQAQFLAHCLPPRSLALFDTDGGSVRLRPHWDYRYDAARADGLVPFWRRHADPVLFHICFQAWQTAMSYYAVIFPDLFGDGGGEVMRDAVKGETGTVNGVMKYAGYSSQRQVYDSDLPFVLDILNTMTREAREIKRMNSKIRSKH